MNIACSTWFLAGASAAVRTTLEVASAVCVIWTS